MSSRIITITAILIGFIFLSKVDAQVITTDPAFPTFDESLTITFDVSEAQRADLVGSSGPIYIHTGVIVNPGENWRFVIGAWGNNNTQPQLENVGENLWQIQIENIREFYNIPGSINSIHQLAFVLRNAAGNQQTEDLFVEIFSDAVSVRFNSPSSTALNPYFADIGEDVLIDVLANVSVGNLQNFSLFINDEEVVSTDESQIEYVYTVDEPGRILIRAVAENDNGDTAEDETSIIANPDVNVANRPAGIIDGINYHDGDDTKVTLSLFAPYKEFVYVIGDFNDWEVDTDYFMNAEVIDDDNVHYWLTVEGLSPGQEYGFQYFIDGEIRVADAYTEKVLDPWHDQQIINEGRYPGLIPYPHGKTQHPVSVLQTAQQPFQWQTEDFVPPAVEDLVIYELLIRDFLHNSTYKALTDTLDYLQNLGVNAIELMPVNQFEGNLSWGYNPSFFFAPDKFYGPRHELKRFVDEAQSRGIAVILDIVWNHSFGQAPHLRMYFDSANNRPSDENPWYSDPIYDNPAMNFGYKLDHGSQHFVEFMDRANRHWIENYRINGFRFDLTKGFTTRYKGPNDPWGSNYDQERVDNLVRLYNEIKSVDPNSYVILEHLADNQEETVLANAGMLLWGNLNYNYNEATMGYVGNSNLSWGYYANRNWNDPHLITYMESHDEQRLMWRNQQFGNQTSSYSTRDLDTALERMGQAAAFFFTIPGPKMIWQFGELGYDYGLGEDGRGRTDPMPVPWDEYLENPSRVQLYNTYRALIHLKTNNEVFATDDVSMNLVPAVKRIYLNHESMDVAIIGNFDVIERTVSANVQYEGTWYDYFSQSQYVFEETNQSITLAPGQFFVFTSEFVELPEEINFTNTPDDGLGELPAEFGLFQNYPNPFNPTTNIRYQMGETGQVQVEVFNLLGQRVATLVNGIRAAGTHTIQFDGSRLSSGIYLVRMQVDGQVFTNKMTLVK